MSNKWYNMKTITDAKGEATPEAEVFLYDNIGGYGITANDFIAELKELGDVETINLRIASGGGSIVEGNTIYNALKRHGAKVITHIDSLAASMASVIAMAGDEVHMAANALFMIHNPWTMTFGDAEDLRKEADLLDQMKAGILGSYSRSNYDPEKLNELMDAETWLTAEEAIDAGFIDVIEGANLAAASITELDLKEFTLPVDKIVASVNQKHRAEVEEINAELTSTNNQLALNATEIAALGEQITSLQIEADESKACIQEMNTTHKEELEQANEVTESAVSAKAAELLALQSQDAVVDDGGNEPSEPSAILSKYESLKNDREARLEFFKENKSVILAEQSK